MIMLHRITRRLADHFILQNTRNAIEFGVLREEVAALPSGRLEFYVGRYPAGSGDARPDRVIFKLPGTTGRAERSTVFPAPQLPDADTQVTEVWTWNPPGYGRSEGRASLWTFPAAVLAAWDYLEQRFGNHQLLVVGNSLGAATSLYLARERSVPFLLLRNPPPLKEIVRAQGHWWNAHLGGRLVATGIPPQLDAVENARHCHSPCVFLQSEHDTLVTPPLQEVVHRAYAGPKKVVMLPGAAHNTPLVDDWLPSIRAGIAELWPHAQVAS